MENENQTPHKRRVHYKGKYPKKFEEKYKELQPEKYKDTIAHVIQKGNTPAGMHISIMVKEILDFLQIKPGQTGFDATLGYGGHTKAMLEQLQGQGHIHATDVDPAESAKTKKRLADQGFGEDMLTIHLQNFCTIDEIAKEVGGFDFVLADLGVSSMQIDNPERGFSFKVDGPLDLRLNQEAGISAAERLDTISRDELAGMLYENSDEPYCEELAKAITDEIRKGHRVDTTTKLRRIIEDTLDFLPEKDKKETIKKTCQRTFQALRIDVNSEFEVLHRAPDVEYSFYNSVKTGDMDAVIENCKQDAFVNLEGAGILSQNPLTNIKYHFVVTTAMITRYCIDGGLEAEQAYRLSDFYILNSCNTIRQVADLHHEMAKDFTGKMVLFKKSSILSKPVMQCVNYIYSHIKERITISTLADYTGLSENYLSRIFKQNLGVSISDYIREKKIEKATHLLRYSDKSLIDIANYLSFSSQSHFIKTFENFMGITPKKYRDKYYKSMW